jgi:hypothetical protein
MGRRGSLANLIPIGRRGGGREVDPSNGSLIGGWGGGTDFCVKDASTLVHLLFLLLYGTVPYVG